MTADRRRLSPLREWSEAFAALPREMQLSERPFLTQLNVRVHPDSPSFFSLFKVLGGTLPSRPCTSARLEGADALWLGPDEWLLVAPPDQQDNLTARVRQALGDDGAVVDVSAQRVALSLSGSGARTVLARGCSLDLDPRAAPTDTCVHTLVARAEVTLVVRDADKSEFLLLVRSSYAAYLAAWLVDAALDL